MTVVASAIIIAVTSCHSLAQAEQLVPVGLRTQLFVDDYAIDQRQNISRNSQPANRMAQPVLVGERPWEEEVGGDPRVLLYGTAFYDPLQQQHRMWYMGRMGSAAQVQIPELGLPGPNIHYDLTSYATSSDGINWSRPDLGVVHFDGDPNNNILLDFHGAAVLLDEEEVDPQKRYKAIGYMRRFGDLRVSYSPDGISWSTPEHATDRPNEGGFNSVHVPGLGYIAGSLEISTDPNHLYVDADGDLQGKRVVGILHTTDSDLQDWSHDGFINPDGLDDPDTQFYGMTPFVYGDNGIVFGFLHVFDVIDPQARFHDGPIDVELVYSRDGVNWNRTEDRQPVIPLGSPGAFDAGLIWQTGNGISLQGDELVAYYSAGEFGHGTQGELSIGRATWQRDRLVALHATSTPGTVTTEPFQLLGEQLEVNVDASGGQVRVDILDQTGQPIPEFSGVNSLLLQGADGLALSPDWQGQTDLSALVGRTIKLKFTMRNADLYAFQVTSVDRVWNIDGSGDWHNVGNWSEGGVPDANDVQVVFGDLSQTSQTVATDAAVTVGGLQFFSPQSYVIAGTGSVNLEAEQGKATIRVEQGTHQIQTEVNLHSQAVADIDAGTSLAFNNRLSLNGHVLTKTGDGTLEVNNTLDTGGGAVVGLAGLISGGGALVGDLLNTGAVVAPGNSPGRLSIVGNYQQASGGTLRIEVGDGVNDVLSVNGQLIIQGGILEISLLEKFQPAAGDTFDVMQFSSAGGPGFETLHLQPLAVGLAWNTSRLLVDGTLGVIAVPEPATLSTVAASFLILMLGRGRARSHHAHPESTRTTGCPNVPVALLALGSLAVSTAVLTTGKSVEAAVTPGALYDIRAGNNPDAPNGWANLGSLEGALGRSGTAPNLTQAGGGEEYAYYDVQAAPGSWDILRGGSDLKLESDFSYEMHVRRSGSGFGGAEHQLSAAFETGSQQLFFSLQGSNTDGVDMFLRTQNGGVSQTVNDLVTLPLDHWIHFVVTFDDANDELKVYENGSHTLTQTLAGHDISPAASNAVTLFKHRGSENNDRRFDGDIAVARLYDFVLTPQQVTDNLEGIGDVSVDRIWNLDAIGDWNSSANWLGGIPDGRDHGALFGSAITAARSVYTNSNVTAPRLAFDSSYAYAIVGSGVLTMNADSGDATIDVSQGSHELQARVDLATNLDVAVHKNASLTFHNTVEFGANNITKTGEGVLHVNSDSNTGAGSVTVQSGTLSGDGTIPRNLNMVDGIVAPGSNTGVLRVNGGYNQSARAVIEIEVAGVIAGQQHDVFDVDGAMVLAGGALLVSLDDGFTPDPGDLFDVLDFGSLDGLFDSVELPELPLGLAWNASALYTSGSLSVALAGDYNNDGFVNAADYTVWRDNLGAPGGTLPNDSDGGVIGPAQYSTWKAHFGMKWVEGSAALSSQLPEPQTGALLVLATLSGAANVRPVLSAMHRGSFAL